MMSAAFVLVESRGQVVIEALRCVTQMDGLTVVEVGGALKTRDEHVFSKNPGWVVNLRNWGEAGVVKLSKDGKTGDHGATMMFIGYPSSHELDSVRMWFPEMN